MSTAAVETVDLRKTFGQLEALRSLSLRVEQGEIFALLGLNGAGKTTWISIVCGLIRPTSGTASVLGHDVRRDAIAARYLIGLVPQELNFDPFFEAREVLYYHMGFFGLRPDRRRVDEVLASVGLSDKANTPTKDLSGGMRRRLLVAKALIHRPKVVFLDEPTAGVDLPQRRELWRYVRELREQGTTIVLTTHYLEEAQTLADRIGIIAQGRLVAQASPKQLIDRFGVKRVQFSLHAAVSEDALPGNLRDAGITLDQQGRRLSMPLHGGAVSEMLSGVAALPGASIIDMQIEQPSLEQVFMALATEAE